MKALILAAGLGTRLRPYSDIIPKPLFPVNGRPVLDLAIRHLASAGAEAVIINTHHRHHQIEAFLSEQSYPLPVLTRYEPQLLGTAGAIKNVSDFWDDRPFMVVNSDIVTDIALQDAYVYHLAHSNDVTLVMHDYPQFNQVTVDMDNHVVALGAASPGTLPSHRKLAFTGIHVLNPKILDTIPAGCYADIITVYNRHLAAGRKISAHVVKHNAWCDIGTPDGYRQAVFDRLAPQAFQSAAIEGFAKSIRTCKLAGDGSDRTWYRLGQPGRSIIMVDHGLRDRAAGVTEAEAFVAIGRHLKASGVPVPEIYCAETFCGLAFIEDLGDTHLQAHIAAAPNPRDVIVRYRRCIDLLILMSRNAMRDFDPAWTYQTPRYDTDLILEKECRYFVEAFLNLYLGLKLDAEHLIEEFRDLARRTERLGLYGFMHRDFQSRNIMVKNADLFFIDFQGGRVGPLQYDLAALLIDPYVALPHAVQDELKDYCLTQLSQKMSFDPQVFNDGYHCCRLTRNLQILGAFGFLTRRKHKHHFEQYIPVAIRTLQHNLAVLKPQPYPRLQAIVAALL